MRLDSLGRVINPNVAKKVGETLKRKHKTGELVYKAHSQSEETRKKISEGRIKYLENHNNYGLRWYNVGGIKVQGTWEKSLLSFFYQKIFFLKEEK